MTFTVWQRATGWIVALMMVATLLPLTATHAGAMTAPFGQSGSTATRLPALGDDGDDDDDDGGDFDDDDDFEVDDDDDVVVPPPPPPPTAAPPVVTPPTAAPVVVPSTGEDDDTDDDDDSDTVVPVAPPILTDDDDDDFVPSVPTAVVSDDDDDDDDDDDAFGGGTIDEPRPDQAIVQLDQGVDPYAWAAQQGAQVLRVIPGPNVVLIQIPFDEDDDNALDVVFSGPAVVWGERNFSSQAPEGRPRYFFSGSDGEPQLVDAPALPAGLTYTPDAACVSGGGIVVAVLDTGIDASHPLVAGRVLTNGVNMVDNSFDVADVGNGIDDDGDGQVDELVGHGTHVAGTVLQVAPDAQILPIKVLNSDGIGDAFFVSSGIYYAVEQGANVINLSLSSTYDSRAVREAIDFATSQGVVVIAAAGNGDTDSPEEYPAAGDTAISVAATNDEGIKATFSNYHETVDISAPGVDVASAYPDGRYATASGTSMSTGMVSGTAALLLERQPDIGPPGVLSVLTGTADPNDPAFDGMIGEGSIDVDAAIACGS